MPTPHVTLLEPGFRIQLPPDWANALGLQGLVALDRTQDGILIRRCQPASWDDIFATKLPVGPPSGDTDVPEVSGDDLLF